jgi:SsrA-binding protein
VAQSPRRVAAENRRARHEYFIDDTVEAGLMLVGTEVKSLRGGRANIADAHAGVSGEELFLFNAYIPEYHGGNRFNHETSRPRKLLLHKREISKLIGTVKRGGVTLIPLSIYFNDKGRAKVELALARGKKLHDKRATEKERDWQREKGRLIRDRG